MHFTNQITISLAFCTLGLFSHTVRQTAMYCMRCPLSLKEPTSTPRIFFSLLFVFSGKSRCKISCFADSAYRHISCKQPTWRTVIFSYIFISILYMFRAVICPSSGESILSILLLACVFLKTSEWSKITISCVLRWVMLLICDNEILVKLQSETKNGNFWKTQQKLKKSKKKSYWQKLNHYNLPFKRK